MWSGHDSFLPTALSNSDLSIPSSCSESKAQTVMTVSISKTSSGVKRQKESHPNISAKSYAEFKSCDVNNVLQTIRRFDQKYSQKSHKQHKVVPVQNDILRAFYTDNISSASDTNSRRGKNMSLEVKPDTIDRRLLRSPHSSLKSSHKISRLFSPAGVISVNSRKGISNNESFDVPENSEFDINKSDFSLRNPLTNVQNSSHSEVHSISNNDFVQEEARPPMQTSFTRSGNISFELNDRASGSSVLQKDSTSKLELQSEKMLNKSQISKISLSEGHHGLTSREYLQRERNVIRTQQTSRLPASEKTGYQVFPKESQLESCDEINSDLSDDSVQENVSFKLTESGERVISPCSNSAGTISTCSEAVINSNLGHLQNTSYLLKCRTDQALPSTKIPTSKANISLYPVLGNDKKVTQLESSQENSVMTELSNSNIFSTDSHGLFKSLPYKILTIEDLVDAHEVQKLEKVEENSGVQREVKGSKEKRIVPANKDNFNKDTRQILYSESEQKTTVESRKEMTDEIDEEIEEDNINATSITDFSVKTNSSYEEMMDQLSGNSEIKYTVQQDISKGKSVSSERTNISPRSLSSQVMSNKSQQEGTDMEDVLSSSVKLQSTNKTASTSHGSDEPSLEKSSSQLCSEESGSLRPNSNQTEIKCLEDTKYCSIGIQTDINVAYHPLLYAKNEIQQLSYSQPEMCSGGGESHSLQEIIPVYRSYSRTERQG